MQNKKIALYIDPTSYHFLQDRLFVLDDGRLNGDRMNAPYVHLAERFRARGIAVHTADFLPKSETSDTLNLYVSMGRLDDYRRLSARRDVVLSAFFAFECPVVDPGLYRELNTAQNYFKRIFSWSDSASLEKFVGGTLRCQQFRWPQSCNDVHETMWCQTERKFLTMINTNKLPQIFVNELYTERLRAIEYYSRTNEIDLYGGNWNDVPFRPSRYKIPYTLIRIQRALLKSWDRIFPDHYLAAARRVYRGAVASKAETLGQYKFAICFENAAINGWITEKIFDCFFAGTIPIYWGAPDIATAIPSECFIDMRQFANYDDLGKYLRTLTDKQIAAFKSNARAFLKSLAFRPFTKETFVERLADIVEEDADMAIN